MSDEILIKGDQHIRYKLGHWNKNGTFDILNNINKYLN